MDQYIHILRNIADRAGVQSLRQIALLPGMKAVLRVTMHYDRIRAASAIVTLCRARYDEAVVEAVYPGYFNNQPLARQLTLIDYEGFIQELHKLDFDHLDDQTNIPFHGVDTWLVERAAGGFLKSVFLVPQTASGDHARLLKLLRQYLPETIRELT
ncbi:MAG TPA: hypothetical protein VHL11_24385 [Phototrophicaceae bacterium]|jgi:hypothetical protein|nr:hypothetical protein [Phototrophicaceae bacterium]